MLFFDLFSKVLYTRVHPFTLWLLSEREHWIKFLICNLF